jgi:chromodomain-helicase-DNA-binding protein 4
MIFISPFIRHGYARWQYISDDRENGLFETARLEQNLPSVNDLIGSHTYNEANVSMRTLFSLTKSM